MICLIIFQLEKYYQVDGKKKNLRKKNLMIFRLWPTQCRECAIDDFYKWKHVFRSRREKGD